MRERWIDYAFMARYGHQSLPELLGRRLKPFELSLFKQALQHWLEIEFSDPSTAKPGDA